MAALTALRVVTGFLFFQHGAPKLFGSLPGTGKSEPPVELFSLVGLSGVLEVVGANGGGLAALYCFVFLFLAACGPGRPSLDERLARRR